MGSPVSPTVPALWASNDTSLSETSALKIAFAMGLREMFIVQTKRTFLVGSGPVPPSVNSSQPSAQATFLQACFAALPLSACLSLCPIIYRATSMIPTNRVRHPEVHPEASFQVPFRSALSLLPRAVPVSCWGYGSTLKCCWTRELCARLLPTLKRRSGVLRSRNGERRSQSAHYQELTNSSGLL